MYTAPKPVAGLNLNPENPTDEQRYEMTKESLSKVGRIEDFENIIHLLSPPEDITRYANSGEFKSTRVGIIGGGLAGMATAFELRKLGFDITVFEPNTERIGGRVYTYYFDKERRLYGELGALRIPVSHETIWHYINLFKLNTEPFIYIDPNTFSYVRDVRVRNDPRGENVYNNIYPLFDLSKKEASTPWPTLYSQIPKFHLSTMDPDIRKQLLMILPRYDYRQEAFENMNMRQAMRSYGLSDDAINLVISLIPTLGGGVVYSSYTTTLSQEYTMDYMNLYRISGGNVNLPLAFYKFLTSPAPEEYTDIPLDALGKVTWKGGYYVYGIHKSDVNGKVTIEYRTYPPSFGDKPTYEAFDYVVSALPFAAMRYIRIEPLFSGRKMQSIRDLRFRNAYKALFLCRDRFWERQGIFGGLSYTDKIIQAIVYPNDHAPRPQRRANYSPNEPGVLKASFSVDQDANRLGNITSTNQYRFVREDVERVHGLPNGYLDKIVMDVKSVSWYHEVLAKSAFQIYVPGQKTEFLYASTTPEYDNRVFFAGEHTSTKNAWMQGALQSGVTAANNVAFYSTIHKY